MNRSKGFTLIELVMVITILGILAAVALPRFTNLQRDARVAKLNAARGSVQAAAAMAYGAAQARTGVPQPNCAGGVGVNPPLVNATPANLAGSGNICTQVGRVPVINWHPTADLNGIVTLAGLTSINPPTAQALANEGYAVTGGGAAANSVITFQVIGGLNPAQCSFTYRPSNGATGTAALIGAVQTNGC